MDLSLGTKISQKRVWIQAQDLRKTFNSLFTREKHTKGYLQKCGEGEIQGSFRVEKSHINPLQSYTRMSSSATHTTRNTHIKTSGKTRAGTGPGEFINQRREQINSQKQQLEKDNLARVVF